MGDIYLADEVWALRAYLRDVTNLPVWTAKPKGANVVFPHIVVAGRLGGGPDQGAPVDNPRVSFHVWGETGGKGRAAMQDATKDLVAALDDMEGVLLDEKTWAYGASGISVRWVPDDTDPDNVIPRNVVDALLSLREP